MPCLFLGTLTDARAAPVAGAPGAPVLVLQVQDAIGPGTADYIVDGIAQAAEQGAPLVVLKLDTPGGLDTSMRQIIQAILASSVPVAVYVSPHGARAASAGTYILYAAHVAAMAPATTLGAATPVEVGMPGATPPAAPAEDAASAPDKTPASADAMTAKRVNDAAAFIRGLAQQRGRNAAWAERAVREAVTLTSSEALRENVIDVLATDVPDLLAQIDGKTVQLPGGEVTLHTRGLTQEVLLPDWRQRLLATITHPSVALILMMLGIYGLIFEFMAPGTGVAGVTGAICLLLGLYAMQLLSVSYAGLGLLLLGLALLGAEVVLSTFGVLGIGGVIAFVAGGILLFDRDVPGFGVPLTLIFGLAVSSALVVLITGNLALRARSRPVVSNGAQRVGAIGEVLTVGDDEAWAQIDGENWKVSSEQPLAAGQRVRVLRQRDLTLEVQVVSHESTGGEAS
ncbi:MAG TPA: nodulation protein NfeD [Burkholderiaceae bacterium]|nr:nodulation protein NfeD [Burkholderiaceae bacterium]